MQLREGQIARVNSLGVLPGASSGGAHRKYFSIANAGEDFAFTQAFRSNTAFGALYVGTPVAASVYTQAFSQRPSSSSPQLAVSVNGTIGFTASSSTLTFNVRNLAAANAGVSAAAQFDGKLHAWFMRVSTVAANNGIWRDGVRQTLSASVACTGTNIDSTQKLRVGNLADSTITGLSAVDPIYLVAAWSELVSDGVAAELSRNPWKLFPSPSRRMMALSAAAAFPTLSAAGMVGITTTGGYPQVALTWT
jgi:hypothetical protein